MSGQTHEAAYVKDLVRRAALDDEDAWRILLDRYSRRVWAVVRSYPVSEHDAQDITQTVLCNLADNLSRLREPDRIGAWLATVTRNECRRHLRGSARTLPFPPEALDRADHRTPESIHLAAEELDRLRAALVRLDPVEERVTRLGLEHPGLSAAETARLAGIPEDEVSRLRRRARRRLHRLLKEHD